VTRAAAVLAVLGALAFAAPARAAVLEPADAAELATTLAEATQRQQVCYGWKVIVSDPTGVEDGDETGSNFGPGQPVDPARCPKYVILTAGVSYVSEYSDSEDSAVWSIESNLDNPPTTQDLAALGYTESGLLGEDNDLAILNAAGALPALVADRGAAPPVPFETERRAAGVGGEPTNTPGSDFLRENGTLLALCALLVVGGLAWLVSIGRAGRRRRRRPTISSTTST